MFFSLFFIKCSKLYAVIFLKNNILCVISGILSGIPFIFPGFSILLFVAPALFSFVLFDSKKPFCHGFLFGASFYLVNSAFIQSLDISWLFSLKILYFILPHLAGLAVASIEGVFSGIFAVIFRRLSKNCREKYFALLFSALWVFYELFTGLSFSPLGYTWARISIPFAEVPEFIQTASLFGPLFISFIIILFSSSLALSLKTKNCIFMVFPSLLCTLNAALSYALYSAPSEGVSISVSAVQNGMNSSEKWGTPASLLAEAAAEEFRGESLLVFPEACIPVYLNKSPYLSYLSDRAEENGVAVLLGGLYKTDEGKNETSVYLFPCNEKSESVSSKRHPVPFGEYTPILNLFSEEIRSTDISGSNSLSPLEYENISAGCLICFDSIFPSYSRETVKNGANILCISTNDSWFSSPDSARLHLYHSIYRCIENSRFGVRSACTGISALIDSKGNILSYLPSGENGRVSGTALIKDDITLYTRFGDLPICIFSLCLILFSIFYSKRTDYKCLI